jgi:CPA1 family monovalent cation:H+ antiporter
MRGVIALAAAIALPHTLADGSPFPQRNVIIFLAFSVILVTLVLQGLTLPPLVRLLGLAGTPVRDEEEETARRKMAEAALAYLEVSRTQEENDFDALYDDITGHYQQRLNALGADEITANSSSLTNHMRMKALSRELLRVERQTAVRLRNEGQISDEVLRDLEHELDLREAGPPHAV